MATAYFRPLANACAACALSGNLPPGRTVRWTLILLFHPYFIPKIRIIVASIGHRVKSSAQAAMEMAPSLTPSLDLVTLPLQIHDLNSVIVLDAMSRILYPLPPELYFRAVFELYSWSRADSQSRSVSDK